MGLWPLERAWRGWRGVLFDRVQFVYIDRWRRAEGRIGSKYWWIAHEAIIEKECISLPLECRPDIHQRPLLSRSTIRWFTQRETLKGSFQTSKERK